MKSQDLNSVGIGTVVTMGGLGAPAAGANSCASSGRLAASTGVSVFFRICVVLVTRPSLTHFTSPGKSTGPYSLPLGATTRYSSILDGAPPHTPARSLRVGPT